MVQSYNLPKCPFCMSVDVEPTRGDQWHCNNCQKDFPKAIVEMEPAPPEEKKPKGK